MKTLLLLLSPVFLFAQDQDIIITNKPDTINCTISKVSKSSLYYTQNSGSTNILALNKVNIYYQDGLKKESAVIGDCDYAINEVDKFTKIKRIYTTPVKLIGNMTATIFASGIILDKYKMLRLGISSGGIRSINKGSRLMLMTERDSVITLYNIEHVVSESSYAGGSIIWSTVIRYAISEEELEYLINNRITDLRYYTTDGYIDVIIKERLVPPFQRMLRCIQ